jgi:hypothetical protein
MIRPELVKEAVDYIRVRTANYEYFFERLDSIDWIGPLREYGFFRQPPAPTREGDSISFPFWPEARFLAKTAEIEPAIVLEVMLDLPDTDNIRVHWDLLDAAIKLPALLAARWARKETKWVDQQQFLDALLTEKLGALAVHLASGGEQEAGITLVRALLQVLPPKKIGKTPSTEEERFALSLREARARFDEHIYEELLRKLVPELTKVLGLPALSLLCDMLSLAIEPSRHSETVRDHSHIWRPAVEEHPQNQIPSLKSSLTTAARDAAEQISVTKEGLLGVIGLLQNQHPDWQIFSRIVLHLLRTRGDDLRDQVRQALLDRKLFEDIDCRHEYVLLLRHWFSRLDEQEREQILTWMEAPPDVDAFISAMKDFDQTFRNDHKVSEEDIASELRRWKFDRLSWLEDQLPESHRAEFDRLTEEFGHSKRKPSEFPSYTTTFVGPSSPLPVGQLASLNVPEIVEYLRDWTPSERFMGPSREGLSGELTKAVTQEPKRFASEAVRFQQLHPTYVRALINGLRESLSKATFDWEPVLRLAAWVVEQKDKKSEEKTPYWTEEDQDWSWSRGAIAHFIETALAQAEVSIPFEARDAVWRILDRLSWDVDPTPEREAKKNGSNYDFATISINATRGQAMHAVIRYALWVRKNTSAGSENGFDDMNEVRSVLDQHLDVSKDPSLAIRSVYGRWFPWLHSLDPRWATENASRIFPKGKKLLLYWEAAWSSYLWFCSPYDEILTVLQAEHREAIERIRQTKQSNDPPRWESNLAGHLMAYYWRGRIGLNTTDELVAMFFSKAPGNVRGYALETIGRWLFHLKEPLDAAVASRLKKLWKWRLDTAKHSSKPGDYAPEIVAFGWWFRSGVFGETWLIRQLQTVLEITAKGESKIRERLAFPIAEKLATISERKPRDAVRCLLTLISGWKGSWPVSSLYRDEVRKILDNALRSGGPAKRIAIEVIDRITGQGDIGFQKLLQESDPN